MSKAAAFKRSIVAQFARPHGLLGVLAGWVMELRPSNRERNRRTVELLQIRPTDDVLEVGFGPGLAVQQIGAALTTGRVVGIDHSATMHQRASHKNARSIREDKVDLRVGSVEGLAALGLEFDKALAINVHMFWSDPRASLAQILAVLRPGGALALTTQPRRLHAGEDDARRVGERMVEDLKAAGFTGVRLEILEMKPVSAACALGQRPSAH